MSDPLVEIEFLPPPIVEVEFPASIPGKDGRDGVDTGGPGGPHTHPISDIVGLQTALDGKAAGSHSHSIANVTGLQTALDGKAVVNHGHAIADVTGLQTALDGKAVVNHGHSIADVTGLQTALDGKSAAGHTHTLSNITDAGTMAGRAVPTGTGFAWVSTDTWQTIARSFGAAFCDMLDAGNIGWSDGHSLDGNSQISVGMAGIIVSAGTFTNGTIAGRQGVSTWTITATNGSAVGLTSARSAATTQLATITLGIGLAKIRGYFVSPSALSNGTNSYVRRCGWANLHSGPTQGVYLMYSHTLGANWMFVCLRDSVITTIDTGVPFAVSTAYDWEVEVNADGTLATGRINGTSFTISTGIPTGSTRLVAACDTFFRAATGTISQTLLHDRTRYFVAQT